MSVKYIHLAWTQARDVTENRLLVLLALADWANDEGICWPTMPILARKARVSLSTARAIIRSLERDGYLTTEIGRGQGHHNTYIISIPPLSPEQIKPPAIRRFASRNHRLSGDFKPRNHRRTGGF